LPLIFAFLLILCNVNAQNLPLSKVRYCIELIGRASYSIYIYHWLLIVFFASFFPKRDYLI
jgi:peptidoglycan/LPS O-acetylase OafA/YrhL